MSEVNEFDDMFEDVEPEVEIVEEKAEAEPATPETEQEAEEAETETTEETEEPVEPEVETTATEKKEWTLSAVLDEREKRQKAVAEAEELRKKLSEYEKSPDDVSVFEDEAGFKAQLEQKTQAEIRNTALNMSQAFAEEVYGGEKVEQAAEWFKSEGVQSPYAVNRFNSAKLPFHEVVKMFDEDQARKNPDAYKAQLKAEILAELATEKPKTPITPSLASKRAVGDSKTSVETFDDILGD